MAAVAHFDATTAWVCDVSPAAKALLDHRFQGVPNLGDLTQVDWALVDPVDVLTAGFPCQDISLAGRGAGIKEGTRSGLWLNIVDAIGVLRPRVVVLENVAAIVSRRPGLDVVLAELARLRFDARWCCVRASDAGAPHRRNRWFLVATDADRAGRGQDDPAGCGVVGQNRVPAGRDEGPGAFGTDTSPAADTERGGFQRRGNPGDMVGEAGGREGEGHQRQRDGHAAEYRGSTAADTESVGRGERRPEPARVERGFDAAVRSGAPAADADGRRLAGDTQRDGAADPDTADGPERRVNVDGHSHTEWGDYAPAIDRWERVLGRRAPEPTVLGRTGRPQLNPIFVEWLMGLPEGWVTGVPGLTRNQQLTLLGNGVVPQQAAFALRMLDETSDREM